MNVLAIGAGSMGRRRLRDLIALNPGRVVLYEPQSDRCREVSNQFGIEGYTDLNQALESKPDAISISTPPALHDQYVRLGLERGLHIFCELPFAYDPDLMASVARRSASYPGVLGISHTIRYYPPFRLIREMLSSKQIGKPLYLEYSLGNYLPDWHPYEDYRKFYAADPKLGGCGFDMLLHELSPIQWWLGPVESVQARFSKVSDLEIQGPDLHDVWLWFENGCRGYFHHDIVEQGTLGRHVRIVGSAGTIEWRQDEASVRLYLGSDKQTKQVPFSEAPDWTEALEASRQMADILARTKAQSGQIADPSKDVPYSYESNYLREMRHFIEAACGKTEYSMATVNEEIQTVRTFHSLLESAENNRAVKVPKGE
ncbi:MAG TPA: Gfo/Idh/MocA family oxidoreductase [Acidobacteriota bacterium]|nr:Gfo/Idh/MocA family oxidoreductase [Acidobacteriota bacterium]